MSSTDTTLAAKNQQEHHVHAAEHLEHAAKSHKEVAKLISTGDHKGAAEHTEVAKKHVANFTAHMAQGPKKDVPATKAM